MPGQSPCIPGKCRCNSLKYLPGALLVNSNPEVVSNRAGIGNYLQTSVRKSVESSVIRSQVSLEAAYDNVVFCRLQGTFFLVLIALLPVCEGLFMFCEFLNPFLGSTTTIRDHANRC